MIAQWYEWFWHNPSDWKIEIIIVINYKFLRHYLRVKHRAPGYLWAQCQVRSVVLKYYVKNMIQFFCLDTVQRKREKNELLSGLHLGWKKCEGVAYWMKQGKMNRWDLSLQSQITINCWVVIIMMMTTIIIYQL